MNETKLTEEYCKRYILACRDEAEDAKRNRMDLNRANYSMYQMEYDFSHKTHGQSKEILSKTRNATEEIKSFFQQALADLDDWWRCTATDGTDGTAMLIRPEEIEKLTNFMLKRADYFSHVGNSVQSGLLGSLAVSKIYGCLRSKPKFITRKEGKGKNYQKHVVAVEDKAWELKFSTVRQQDYYPDPHGANLYRIEECEIDLSEVRALTEGDYAIYDKTAVETLKPWGNADLQDAEKERETGLTKPIPSMRPRVKLTEFWGNIIDENTGEMLAENIVITLANEDTVIRKVTPNPLWHQKTPLIAAPMIEVANSVWGIALMDAGTKHNHSLIEVFNLMLDEAMKTVWGINQVRVQDLSDQKQITNGIPWGTNLKVEASLPPGAKVMEPVVTGNISGEVFNVYNLLMQETLTSMRTNDLRMGGQSTRAVKATEVVAAENSITSVFQGMAKCFEEKMIQPELELAWQTIAQNWDLIDPEIFKSLFGAERGTELSQLEPQEIFVQTVNGTKFEVYGISLTLRRQADFRKWTTLLQVVGGSEVLTEAFLQEFSFQKYLGEVMTALDINKDKIRNGEPSGMGAMPQEMPPAPGGPDMMSQMPEAQAVPEANPFAAAFGAQQMAMPSSQALR